MSTTETAPPSAGGLSSSGAITATDAVEDRPGGAPTFPAHRTPTPPRQASRAGRWIREHLVAFFGLLALLRHRASVGGVNILAQWLQEARGFSAGQVQMSVDLVVVLAALWVLPPVQVAQSVVGAIAIGAILALNHKPGRYLGV